MSGVRRRDLLGAAVLAPLASAAGTAEAAGRADALASGGGGTARRLTNATPREQLHAFMKVYTSLRAERVWYWYTGVLHAARPNEPVVPVIACDSLIRRDVLPQPDGSFGVRTFEANYYHPIDDPAPALRFRNPLNGRDVEPLHYREGPHVQVLSERGMRWVSGTEVAPPPARQDMAVRSVATWQQAGPVVWATREMYGDRPHPLDAATWRLESSGARMSFGSFSNYFTLASQLDDESVTRADCEFSYQALTVWWPWMLMGSAPGQMLWRANGRKLRSFDEIPADSRAGFERLHPTMFGEAYPWTEPTSLWSAYPREREPVAP
jgi:hypothetical protein